MKKASWKGKRARNRAKRARNRFFNVPNRDHVGGGNVLKGGNKSPEEKSQHKYPPVIRIQ